MSTAPPVTGGSAGFIGCAVSKLLKGPFDRIVAVDSLHPQVHPTGMRPTALDPSVEFVKDDVTERDVQRRGPSACRLQAEHGHSSRRRNRRHRSVPDRGAATPTSMSWARRKCWTLSSCPRLHFKSGWRDIEPRRCSEGAWQDAKVSSYPGGVPGDAGGWAVGFSWSCLPFERHVPSRARRVSMAPPS